MFKHISNFYVRVLIFLILISSCESGQIDKKSQAEEIIRKTLTEAEKAKQKAVEAAEKAKKARNEAQKNPGANNAAQKAEQAALGAQKAADDVAERAEQAKREARNNDEEAHETDNTPFEIKTGLTVGAQAVRVKLDNVIKNPDGNSWDSAYPNLQAAIDAHLNDDEVIVVIAGPAKIEANIPSPSGYLINLSNFNGTKLSIFGGFTGNESDFSKISGRGNFPAYPLILNGNKKAGIIDSYFYDPKDDREINLFGLVIENSKTSAGNRDGALLTGKTKMNLSYIKFISNETSGAGAAINASKAAIALHGSIIFKENSAEISGGAIVAVNSSIVINAFTKFLKNKAINGNGGALRLYDTDLTVNNFVTFIQNQAYITEASAFFCNRPILGDKSKIQGAVQLSEGNWQQQ